MIKSILLFILLVSGLFAFMLALGYGIRWATRHHIEQQPTSLRITSMEFHELLQKDSSALQKYIGQYIEIEGDLLNIINVNGGGTDIRFTAGQQTDSSYQVAMPLIVNQLIKPTTPCDSLMKSYATLYCLKSQRPYIEFFASIYNQDTLTNFKYYGKCIKNIYTRKYTDYLLENFCLEKIVLKGQLGSITKKDSSYEVIITPSILLQRTQNKKKTGLELQKIQ